MVSIKDIAAHANVSIAAVSHVLNGTKPLSPEITRRIRAAASALNYRPNETARALRTGRSKTLGLILPDLTNPYFPTLAQVVQREASELGYALFLIDSADDLDAEKTGLDRLANRRVDGVIWAPITDDPSTNPMDSIMPIVAIDRSIPEVDCVSADHRQCGVLLGRYIQTLGHPRIGLLNGPQSLRSARLRRAGILASLGASIEVVWEYEVDFSLTIPDEVASVLALNNVSLIVAANDAVALRVLHTLAEAAIAVPDQISVIGFDDIPLAELAQPPLTTVRQPLQQIGVSAVHLLNARLNGAGDKPRQYDLPGTLIERSSTSPHKAKRSMYTA